MPAANADVPVARSGPSRGRAVAGVIAAPLFLGTAALLSAVQSDFMRTLGWEIWPSGLALGPYGWVQVANFIVLGALMLVFAVAVGRATTGGWWAWVGPSALAVAGMAEMLAAFNTDPADVPVTWHGQIHSVATGIFFAAILVAYVGIFVRRDPLWRGTRRYLLLAVPLFLLSELPNPWGNLLFFAALLTPLEVMAVRLWLVSRRTPGTGHADMAADRLEG